MEDYIGRADFVNKIKNIIDLSNKDKSWTFAIDGSWGSGKTFVLNMLEKDLEDNDDNIVIRYDAWKNDFYNEPLIAIIYNILNSNKLEQVSESFKQGLKVIWSIFSKLLNYIPVVKTIKDKTEKVVEEIKKKAEKENSLAQEFISYEKAIELLRKELTTLTKGKKLIILVDELDRCEPDYALSVLNRLHHLFNVENCVVVIALNKSILENVIKVRYGDNNNQYFEKFFDLTFSLSNEGKLNTKRKYAENFLLEFLNEEDLSKAELFFKIIETYLKTNARTIVKFFEKLRFLTSGFNTKDEKYDFACFASFLLLNNKFYIDESKDVNKQDKLDYYVDHQNNFEENFEGDLLEYLISSIHERYIFGGHSYRDNKIKKFICMLTIIKYENDEYITAKVQDWYNFEFDAEMIENINHIEKLIYLLS